MRVVLKYFSYNYVSVISVLLSFNCLLIFILRSPWFLVWRIVFNWKLDILDIILWGSITVSLFPGRSKSLHSIFGLHWHLRECGFLVTVGPLWLFWLFSRPPLIPLWQGRVWVYCCPPYDLYWHHCGEWPCCCWVVVKVLTLHWIPSDITSVEREPHDCQVKVEVQAPYMVSTPMVMGRVIIIQQGEKSWFPAQLSLMPPQRMSGGSAGCHSIVWQE